MPISVIQGLALGLLERFKLFFAELRRNFLGRKVSTRQNAVRILHFAPTESEAHDDPDEVGGRGLENVIEG